MISQLSGAAAEDGEDSTEPIPKQTSLPTSAHHREPLVHRLVTYLQAISNISPTSLQDKEPGLGQRPATWSFPERYPQHTREFFLRKWQKNVAK